MNKSLLMNQCLKTLIKPISPPTKIKIKHMKQK